MVVKEHVEIYHLFLAYAAVTRSVILPMAVLDELLRGAECQLKAETELLRSSLNSNDCCIYRELMSRCRYIELSLYLLILNHLMDWCDPAHCCNLKIQ
jgi:hypothetical protein